MSFMNYVFFNQTRRSDEMGNSDFFKEPLSNIDTDKPQEQTTHTKESPNPDRSEDPLNMNEQKTKVTGGLLSLLVISVAIIVGNLYYTQSLLTMVAQYFHISQSQASLSILNKLDTMLE